MYREEKPGRQEDLELLLASTYTEAQREGRLEPFEKVVRFYSISARPARMFIPRKTVLMDGYAMENIAFHTVFK